MAEEKSLSERVNEALNKVNPMLQADGGGVELVELDEENLVVKVRLKGACAGCMGAMMTLEYAVKANIQALAPEIKEVVSVN